MTKSSPINRTIFKVLSIFTSIQVVNMLCSMVKMKFVSIWLEATGVGLFGIFQVVSDTTATITDFGLRQSTTREVALNRNNPTRRGRLFATIRSWNFLAGILGAVILSAVSPLLSMVFFESTSFWWTFVILGVCILLNALAAGENSILQGLSRFKQLAQAGLLSSIAGLAISIPLFRFLGHSSVILSILVYSLCGLYFVHTRRPRDIKSERPRAELLREGKGFAKLGGYMAVAAFVSTLSTTLFVVWLNRYASTEEVGFFQAGNTLVIRYMGFVLTAIGLEFYPRISACARSSYRQSIFVSHEIVFSLSILTPLVILFLVARPLIVRILYTPQFEVIIPFITIGIIHTILRVPSAIIAFAIVSRGHGLLYFVIESVDAIFGLSICILAYLYFGLAGIGAAYVVWYLFYLTLVWIVATRKFQVRVNRNASRMILLSTAVCGAVAFMVVYTPLWIQIPVAVLLLIPYARHLMRVLL